MLIAAVAVAVSACGRRGALDTPFEAQQNAREEAERNNQPLPPEPTPPVRDRPFVLDRLI